MKFEGREQVSLTPPWILYHPAAAWTSYIYRSCESFQKLWKASYCVRVCLPVHMCVALWPWTCLPLESVWRNTYLVVSWSGEGSGTPLQYSCLENPMDGGAWWAAVHGVTKSRTDWATSLSLFTFMHWRRKWQPTPVFLPGESQGRGSLVGCRLWVCTESDTTEAT